MKVFIVEDNPLLLDNLTILLGGEPDIEVAGTATSAETAQPRISETSPDVLLVDIGLPGMSGIELIARIKRAHPDLDIIAHTIFDSRQTVFEAIKAGASGYLLKGSTPRELVEALHSVHAGGAPMTPRIARAVIRELQDSCAEEAYILTPREVEILRGLESGFTYQQLADDLSISHHTVHTHIKNTYEKLHAKGRQDALIKARKKGLLWRRTIARRGAPRLIPDAGDTLPRSAGYD